MAKGDQIYVMRELLGIPSIYEHHGIDCGDGTVIHYRKTHEAVVTRTSLAEFASGQPVYTKSYTVCYIPDIVVTRAESRLDERSYDLFTNNCEHFATWCKTGKNESAQLLNYGLRPELINVARSRPLIDQATYEEDPARSLALFRQAIANLLTAESTLLPQYQEVQTEVDTWHRTALLALRRNREDLAQAALVRKVAAKQRLKQLEPQIEQLETMKQTLQRNSEVLRQRLASV